MWLRKVLIFLLLASILLPSEVTFAAPPMGVADDQVAFSFPNTATFSATLSSSANITSVVLEYGNVQQTCGEVIAKAFPNFTPAATVNVTWTWDMRQSGSLPPGATIWWHWRYQDASGAEFVSDKQTAIWIDNQHNWQVISGENLRLHYYGIDQSFAHTMLNAGLEGLRRNKEQAGLTTDVPIDVYVYPNYADMKNAILYEPSWLGGQAYPDYNIVILGLSGSDNTWDKNTVIHELTHVLVGHLTFSCIGTVPGWLNEGLAMFSEGELEAGMQLQLDQAIRSNTLISLRSLEGGFSELPDKANLSYSQSYSVVKFLIDTYGENKMTQLLIDLKDAKPIDAALLDVYGFDTEGLEAAWRKSVGAAPRAASAQPTAQLTPTFVPTYIPFSGLSLAATPTPYGVPTSSTSVSTASSSSPPRLLTVMLLCLCLVILFVFGISILGIVVRRGNAKSQEGKHDSTK